MRKVHTERNQRQEIRKDGSVRKERDGLRHLQAVHAATDGSIGLGQKLLNEHSRPRDNWSYIPVLTGCGSDCCGRKAS